MIEIVTSALLMGQERPQVHPGDLVGRGVRLLNVLVPRFGVPSLHCSVYVSTATHCSIGSPTISPGVSILNSPRN
jgi:hypothetical protein